MEERTLREILRFLQHNPDKYLDSPVVEVHITLNIDGEHWSYNYPKKKRLLRKTKIKV